MLAIVLASAACGDGDNTSGDPQGPPGAPGTAAAVGTATPTPARTTEVAAASPTATATAEETAVVSGKPAVYWVHTDW